MTSMHDEVKVEEDDDCVHGEAEDDYGVDDNGIGNVDKVT